MTVSAVANSQSTSSGGPMLSLGSKGTAVVELQRLLAQAGFNPGGADGVFGTRTRAAVIAFQRSRGLLVDGVCGPRTLAALRVSPRETAPRAPAPPVLGFSHPTLSIGAHGAAVAELQRALMARGFSPGAVDDAFGPLTRAAVVRFQASRGLVADGVVGPRTWGALGGGGMLPPVVPVGPAAPEVSGSFRQRILQLAASQIGIVEASNHNDGAVTRYPGYFGRGPESWCADFASWVLRHVGGSLNDPYCPSIRNRLIASGNWKGRSNPQPGDLVLFDWNHDGIADHIGFVKSVNANGTLTTIEGNTTGPDGREGVWEKTRVWDTVLGFGNPI
jgi:peptidoglycan hydrolase-like protein with peptidoglycan-binding domain